MTWPKMMPWKTEKGGQPERSEEPSRSTSRVVQDSGLSTSQKRRSQSCPQDEADSKKGQMEEGTSWSRKVQTGIDWANTGIHKPAPRPDPQHPSFKPDPSGATNSPPLPWIKGLHHQQSQPARRRTTTPASQTQAKGSRPSPAKFPGDPKK